MVVRAAPVLPAMSRMLQPAAFSRSTSRIFLTGSLFLGTASSFELQACNSVKKDACLPWWTKARPARERPLSAGALSAFSRRGVRDGPERCPLSIGTGVRFEPDYAPVVPRIHDLRHSFAVHTLVRWHKAGEDVGAMLPRLSTYMGHLTPGYTYWYLSAAPELLALAAARLEKAKGPRA